MSFLTDAQETLTAEEYEQLKSLAAKVAAFEATREEDKKLSEIKNKVYEAVATRDRVKNLNILAGKAYSIQDMLTAAGYTEDEVKAAVNKMYPKAAAPVVTIATYKIDNEEHELKMGERVSDTLKAVVDKGGVKLFVANADLDWLLTETIPKLGPYKDKSIFKNINAVATRFKWDKADLLKQAKARKEKESKATA